MSQKVLVVDDDPSLVQLMTANLEEEGYAVISGYDGAMALQLAKSVKPDLIILDVNMPMTSGLKALENIRATPETQKIPVSMLTGETSDRVFPNVQNVPRVMHIKKPVDLEELNHLVRQTIQQYPVR
jgi:two-component system alkaline phosphatase synthesis response regulator PhoP